MPQYKTKPSVVEAQQYTGTLFPGLAIATDDEAYAYCWPSGAAYCITTHGQKTWVVLGDYIVKEPNGNGYYPVKQEIFEAKYEPIEEVVS